MSSASATRTIKFLQKAGTYTATIMSPSGDLWQTYEGSSSDPQNITPDFVTTQPELRFVCMSSRVAEGTTTPTGMTVYFNDNVISFSESNGYATGDYAGYFQLIAPTDEVPYYRLVILDNLVELAGCVNCTIKMEATVAYGSIEDTIQASYTIKIEQSTGNTYRVTIAAGDDNNFVITDKDGSVILKALAYLGGVELEQNLGYTWQQMGIDDDGNVGWITLTNQNAQTLTVAADDVNTYGEYRVIMTRDDEEIGSDIQSVMDASDPYDIEPCPNPEDETIEEGDTSATVVYTPKIVKRGQTAQAKESLFYFVVKDAAGVILNPDTYETAASTGTVEYGMCEQAGGDVTISIISQS